MYRDKWKTDPFLKVAWLETSFYLKKKQIMGAFKMATSKIDGDLFLQIVYIGFGLGPGV